MLNWLVVSIISGVLNQFQEFGLRESTNESRFRTDIPMAYQAIDQISPWLTWWLRHPCGAPQGLARVAAAAGPGSAGAGHRATEAVQQRNGAQRTAGPDAWQWRAASRSS